MHMHTHMHIMYTLCTMCNMVSMPTMHHIKTIHHPLTVRRITGMYLQMVMAVTMHTRMGNTNSSNNNNMVMDTQGTHINSNNTIAVP